MNVIDIQDRLMKVEPSVPVTDLLNRCGHTLSDLEEQLKRILPRIDAETQPGMDVDRMTTVRGMLDRLAGRLEALSTKADDAADNLRWEIRAEKDRRAGIV